MPPVALEPHNLTRLPPPKECRQNRSGTPHIHDEAHCNELYTHSITDPDAFFARLARELLTWTRDFTTVRSGGFEHGDTAWFLEGRLSPCYNAVDRHAIRTPDKIAIIYEADRPGEGYSVTYAELLREVCRVAQVLQSFGVQKGDVVTIYLPMIPEALITMLAVIRNPAIQWDSKRDYWWHEEVVRHRPYCPPVAVASEDPLFLLYTSGSTGTPKGVVHAAAGYLLGAAATTNYSFDVNAASDVVFTAGDVGWITGHTYAAYGPLLLGATTVVFEGTPAYPTPARLWQIIDAHQVTQFYVAPTALRLLKRAGPGWPRAADLRSLRTLGSVGEPIAPDVWRWFHELVGRGRAHVCDTYWQTETGAHIIAPVAGVTHTKPGSACRPVFGIDPAIIDPESGRELFGGAVEGVLAIRAPWPFVARTVWGSHARYLETYLRQVPGYYFTGDGAARDRDGYYWIRGRVDDVANVSGHRLSTADIEAALVEHAAVAEGAVVAIADELTGQAVAAFVTIQPDRLRILSPTATSTSASAFAAATFSSTAESLKRELTLQVRRSIGPFAAPKIVVIVQDMPKTRSGKILRRILRKLLAGEEERLGDTSVIANPEVLVSIIKTVRIAKQQQQKQQQQQSYLHQRLQI
ncbi:hypothetical protein D0Z03_001896 [Geotrichum reessii]|nr:hypothetical protein D0Z03_001896 [Galactomyces reessii]